MVVWVVLLCKGIFPREREKKRKKEEMRKRGKNFRVINLRMFDIVSVRLKDDNTLYSEDNSHLRV